MKDNLLEAINRLFDAIDEAADGQEAWREHEPYRDVLKRARELRAIVEQPETNSEEQP